MTVVRGNKGVGRAVGGAAAPTALIAPVPLNTPSVKRENNGRDPSVNLLPSRNAGIWGQGGAEDGGNEPRQASQPAPVASKPAPWAKPAAGPEQSAEAASKPVPTTRAPTANWADVDVDSDEDDDATPPAPAPSHAPAPQPASSNPAQGGHWAPTEASHPSFGFGNAAFGQGQGQSTAGAGPADPAHRKERSGSFNDPFGGGDQRRFGGFGSAPYGGQQQQQDDGRFGSRPFGSNDGRFGGPPPGEFGVSLLSSCALLFSLFSVACSDLRFCRPRKAR